MRRRRECLLLLLLHGRDGRWAGDDWVGQITRRQLEPLPTPVEPTATIHLGPANHEGRSLPTERYGIDYRPKQGTRNSEDISRIRFRETARL